MNAFISDEQYCYELEDQNDSDDKTKFGDVLATLIVIFFAVSALIISGWSTVIYLMGNVQKGGPLEDIFRVVYSAVKTSGIV